MLRTLFLSLCGSLLFTSLSVDARAATVDVVEQNAVARYVDMQLRDTSKLLKPAREAFDAGNVKQARELLEKITAESAYLPHHDVQLALWFFNAGRKADGVRTMEHVAMMEPNRPDVRYLFAEIARSEGRYFDAWTHALVGERTKPRERWSKDYSDHLQALMLKSKAMTADARGDWENSLRLHLQLRVDGNEDLATDLALGRAAFHQDIPDQAEQHFRRAASRENANLAAELVMASLYDQKGEKAKAEAWFQRGEKAPANVAEKIRLEYVRWLLRQNRADDARTQASKLRPSKERLRDFQYMIAMCERMKGNFPAMERILEKLHEQAPDAFQVSNQLAIALIESDDEGKKARAMLLATRNAKAAPNAKDAVSTLAWIKHRLGETAEAEQLLNLILRGGQASRDEAYYVSKVKRALKRDEEADLLLTAAKNSSGEFFNEFRVDK